MDTATSLLTAGTVAYVVGLVFVGIVVVAMPFLVWNMHSSMKEFGRRLTSIERGLTSMESDLSELSDIAMTINTVEVYLEAIGGEHLSSEELAALGDLNRLRLQSRELRVQELELKTGRTRKSFA